MGAGDTMSKPVAFLLLACVLQLAESQTGALCESWRDGQKLTDAISCGAMRYNQAQQAQMITMCATTESTRNGETTTISACDAAFACVSPAPYLGGGVLGGNVILDGQCLVFDNAQLGDASATTKIYCSAATPPGGVIPATATCRQQTNPNSAPLSSTARPLLASIGAIAVVWLQFFRA